LPKTRILLVEDFKPHRSWLVNLLCKNPDLNVISETDNGLDAIDRAQELQPDVILLDIGLPQLNGLEAARRILGLVPSARIIFLTQESDADVVKEAFRLGAWGYVQKEHAQTHLLAAVAAVLQGNRFLNDGLA
jgi:DNA-binding NarL/FixJ family response regulator